MKNKLRSFLFLLLMFTLMVTTVNAYEQNINLSIASVTSRVDSGDNANFIVDLKTTGSNRVMKDVDIRIDLPEDFEMETKLEDLRLIGKEPSLENNQLIYHFSELRTGISERMIMSFKTRNGYDLNNERVVLKYSLSTAGTQIVSDEAEIKINASGSVSAAKTLMDVDGGGPYKPARSKSTLTWQLRVSSNKRNRAQLFLKEGSQIHVTDTLPEELEYVKDNHDGYYDAKSHSITWVFDAPTYTQQDSKQDYLFLETIEVETRVKPIKSTTYSLNLSNKMDVSAILIDNANVSDKTVSNVIVTDDKNIVPPEVGMYYRGGFRGPADGKGAVGNADNPDPIPIVYDTATVAFRHRFYIHPGTDTHLYVNNKKVSENGSFSEVKGLNLATINKNGYKWIRSDYTIDNNLIMNKLELDIPVYSFSSDVKREVIPVTDLPLGEVTLKDSQGKTIKHQIDYRELNGKKLTLHIDELFNDSNVVVKEMSILIKPNSNQKVIDGRIAFSDKVTAYYNIKPGFVGDIKNKVKSTFIPGKTEYQVTYEGVNKSSAMGPRHAKVIFKPMGTLPIAETTIKFEKDYNGVVLPEENMLDLKLRNTDGSLDSITGNYDIFLKIPRGIELFLDEIDVPAPYQLLTKDLVGSTEDDNIYKLSLSGSNIGLLPAKELKIKIPVNISENTSSIINMDIYAHSTSKSLKVPQYPTEIPTNTVIVTDEDSLHLAGLLESKHNYIKSENHYSMIKRAEVHTRKSVKGDLDDVYSDFAHATAGSDVAYRLELDHTVDTSLKEMVILDVLPSMGDLGITDNESRGSQFSLELEGALALNESMREKFNVYYSTSAHPKRDDLSAVANNNLINPTHSEPANWMLEEDVENWADIKSFKIKLKPNQSWKSEEKLTIDFMMKAPDYLDDDLITLSKEDSLKYDKAAWNSFAVALPNLHVVEPAKVGVAVIDEIPIREPQVEKHVVIDDVLHKEVNVERDENIKYLINVELPASINAYEKLTITDELHENLDLISLVLNGEDLEYTPSTPNKIYLEFTREELFKLKKQGKNHIELEVIAKLNKITLDEDLETIAIPNTAKVTVNNEVSVEPEKPTFIKPSIEYGNLVAVVNEGNNSIVELDSIDDYSMIRLKGSSIRIQSYGDNPFDIDFLTTTAENSLIHKLPAGQYILRQEQALDGYIKTEESLIVEVKNNQLSVIEVLNPKEPTPAKFLSNKNVSIDSGKDYATLNDVLTYAINIKNIGETQGTAKVIDTLETISEYVIIDEDQEIIISGLEIEEALTVGSLMSGIELNIPGLTDVQILFSVRLNSDFDETLFDLTNIAKVNDEEIKSTVTVKAPRIEIVKSVIDENENEIAEANERLYYKIIVSNIGDDTAYDVLISDSMKNLKNFVEIEDTAKVTHGESIIDMDIEAVQSGFTRDIAVGEKVIIEYEAVVKENLAESQKLVNTAFANDKESTVTITHHKPLLEISKIVKDENENGFVESGEWLFYEIHVRNIGELAAIDTMIVDRLDEILPYIEDPKNETVSVNDVEFTTVEQLQKGITIGKIDVGELIKVQFKVKLQDITHESLDELINTAYVNDVPTTVEIPVRHPKGEEPIQPNPVEPVDPNPEKPVEPTPEEPIQPTPENPVVPGPEEPEGVIPQDPEEVSPSHPEEPKSEEPNHPEQTEPVENFTPPNTGVAQSVKLFYALLIINISLLIWVRRKKQIDF